MESVILRMRGKNASLEQGGFSMPDYKAMYFHLAGQMSIAVEALEGLVAITERLKKAQQITEDMFMEDGEEGLGDNPEKTI